MEQLVSLDLWILNAGLAGDFSEQGLRERWHEWASHKIRLRLSFLDVSTLHAVGGVAWPEVVSLISHRMGEDAALVINPHLRPNGSLLDTLGKIMELNDRGWWFSVKAPPFYLHNVLVKKGTRLRHFEMDGVFYMDHERLMFFNQITGSHFLHSQDAPCILTSDSGLCFIDPQRFELENPLPYEFRETDYFLDRLRLERNWLEGDPHG